MARQHSKSGGSLRLSEFLEILVRLGLKDKRYLLNFRPEVLRRWLEDHAWVSDSTKPCAGCALKTGWFSEEHCRRNVEAGGQCYRETLRTVFVPFVQAALRDEVFKFRPGQDGFVHRPGPTHDGMEELTLSMMIDHELGGTLARMAAETSPQRDL